MYYRFFFYNLLVSCSIRFGNECTLSLFNHFILWCTLKIYLYLYYSITFALFSIHFDILCLIWQFIYFLETISFVFPLFIGNDVQISVRCLLTKIVQYRKLIMLSCYRSTLASLLTLFFKFACFIDYLLAYFVIVLSMIFFFKTHCTHK